MSREIRQFGYNLKLLRVDLTQRNHAVEKIPYEILRTYIGGSAIGAYFLLKELKPRIDPFSSSNLIVISTSPATTSKAPGLSMFSISFKSPLTGLVGEVLTPGSLGYQLKCCGYDVLLVTGRSDLPVYICITDSGVIFNDARDIWGKKIAESYDFLLSDCSLSNPSVLLIGPAGENLVSFANTSTDVGGTLFTWGRMGAGAVMGSKNLKAILVKSDGEEPRHKDEAAVKELSQLYRNGFMSNPINKAQYDEGNMSYVSWGNAEGIFSVKNLITSYSDTAPLISGEKMSQKYGKQNVNCDGCFNGCRKILLRIGGLGMDVRYGSPDLETIISIPGNCLISDMDVALRCYEAVASNGMDGASLGGTIAFAIECFERGLIDESQTDGLKLEFGDGDAVLRLIEMIIERKGFGDLLAKGSKKAAEFIGGESSYYAMQSKGLELPMHEPRAKAMLGLGYAVSPVGPHYVVVEHDTDFDLSAPQLFMDQIAPLGLMRRFEATDLSKEKVRLYFYIEQVFCFLNVLCACIYANAPVRFYSFANLVNLFNAITGWEASLFEFMKAGERKNNLNRLFAYREGFRGKDDVLPERVFEPIESGPKADCKLDKDNFYEMVKFYYEMAGWNFETGRPNTSKLVELGIEFA